MGLSDKFKDIAKQAQDAVAEHRDQIQEAVDAAGVAADRKTKGKYTDKIAKYGQKAGDAVDKLGGDAEAGESAEQAGAGPVGTAQSGAEQAGADEATNA